jgi:hypothetical protein
MTSPDNSSAPKPAPQSPQYADRTYRPPEAMMGGVLLLALGAWIGVDAIVRGEGRTPWVTLAALVFVVPLVVAYTLRPAVFAGAERLRIRNPLRTITLPWASVEDLRAGYTSEVLAGGRKYQLWAIPVSLRARKRAISQAARAGEGAVARRTPSDQAMYELRDLAERHAKNESAQGEPSVRWAYEIIVPSAVGAILLAVLSAMG